VATALPAMGRSLPPRRPAPCEAMAAARRLWSWWACCLYESASADLGAHPCPGDRGGLMQLVFFLLA